MNPFTSLFYLAAIEQLLSSYLALIQLLGITIQQLFQRSIVSINISRSNVFIDIFIIENSKRNADRILWKFSPGAQTEPAEAPGLKPKYSKC
jgi:hypothetical protein